MDRPWAVYRLDKKGNEGWIKTPVLEWDTRYWQQCGYRLRVKAEGLSIQQAEGLLTEEILSAAKKVTDLPQGVNGLQTRVQPPLMIRPLLWMKETGLSWAVWAKAEAFLQGRSLLWNEVAAWYEQELPGSDQEPDVSLQGSRQKTGGPSVDESLWILLQGLVLAGRLKVLPGVWWERQARIFPPSSDSVALCRCMRCGEQKRLKPFSCTSCGERCYTCEACLVLGACRSCTPLVIGVAPDARPVGFSDAAWPLFLDFKGVLTPFQQEASSRAVELVQGRLEQRELLIHAVTGAGKTEIVFEAIAETLKQGARVAVIAPRRDVVRELAPRFQQAFANVSCVALYGGSEARWQWGELMVMTAHQAVRFRAAFRLVVVDEVDAFPFHHEPMLPRAVFFVREPAGRVIYLSATPSTDLLARVHRGEMTQVTIPERYHGHPLPLPHWVKLSRLRERVESGKVIAEVREMVRLITERDGRALIFVPRVSDVGKLLNWWQQQFPTYAAKTRGVYASDPERDQKVAAFRTGALRFLVTTTILERGVSIPNCHVLIWCADAEIFDEAAIVQMAGRAGRDSRTPEGYVWMLSEYRTAGMTAAVAHIRRMNRLAQSGRFSRASRRITDLSSLLPDASNMLHTADSPSTMTNASESAPLVKTTGILPASSDIPDVSSDMRYSSLNPLDKASNVLEHPGSSVEGTVPSKKRRFNERKKGPERSFLFWKTLKSSLISLLYPAQAACLFCGRQISTSSSHQQIVSAGLEAFLCDSCRLAILWVIPDSDEAEQGFCQRCGRRMSGTGGPDGRHKGPKTERQKPQVDRINIPDGEVVHWDGGGRWLWGYAGLCNDCEEWTRRGSPLLVNRSLFQFEGLLREQWHQYKYRGRRSLEPVWQLAIRLGWHRFAGELGHVAWVVPVPLHPVRLRERGFNQAEVLARMLSEASGLPLLDVLVRNRQTEKQSKRAKGERLTGIEGAFGWNTGEDRVRVAQKDVLLVDDIYTTGSTLDACAQVLKHAGAARVMSFTLARS